MRYYIQSAFALPDQEKMDQEQASLIKISDSFKKRSGRRYMFEMLHPVGSLKNVVIRKKGVRWS